MEITCIILAGGKASRLGRNKLLETIGDKNLFTLVVDCLSTFGEEIIIVTAEGQHLPQIHYPKTKIITDIYPGKGPMGGVFTGLTESTTSYNLVVAADMPFLNKALLDYMIQVKNSYDLVVPRLGNLLEPLHAVYSRNSLRAISQLLQRDQRRISLLFDMLNIKYVDTDEIDRFDPQHLSFFNINTEVDLIRARQIALKINYDKCRRSTR